jgi:hypothetical protein
MGTGDGTVVGTQQIVNNGPRNTRFNLVLVPEGYQQGDMQQWQNDAAQFVNVLERTPPFDDPLLRSKLNVFRLNVTSTDRGADKPAACFGTGASTVRTFFDGTYCANNLRRLLVIDNASVRTVLDAQVSGWTQALVIVNDTEHGGSGGRIPVTAKGPSWELTAIHELGHSVFGLADEYEYYAGCGIDTDRNRYTGIEPGEPNVTIDSNRATIEWAEFIDAATPMPTTSNANCQVCDPQPNPVAAATVGAFEGAQYFHCGIFRPQFDCMMRNFSAFCAVCTDAIRQTLRQYSGVPRQVEVRAPDVNFLFNPSGTITVSDFVSALVPNGVTGQGRLQSRMFPRAPAGTAAAGLFGYEYRVNLAPASGGGPGACVSEFSLDVGPIIPLNYDGSGLSHVFITTLGGLGSVRPSFAEQVGDRLIFTFNPSVCPGATSFFFGLSSRYPARDVTAQVRDAAGNVYSLPAKAPTIPPLP